MTLSNSEEQLMNILWEKGSAFMKDLLEAYPEPRPAATTVATLLKRLADKGAITYKTYGNSREYVPLVKKTDYFSDKVNTLVKNFFNDSPSQFASFFTTATDMSEEELNSLKKIIDDQIKNK
jgi:BlaI family transcriptional regulator, penicillinase repressor